MAFQKKILSAALAAVMALSALSLPALAAQETEPDPAPFAAASGVDDAEPDRDSAEQLSLIHI